jgi:hypothetical protein
MVGCKAYVNTVLAICLLRLVHLFSAAVQEWGNMALLVLLYAMQGIPLGLTMGAM